MSSEDVGYYNWIAIEARKIHSDGCSGVPDWHLKCCYEHDLGYYYGRDPRAAYAAFLGADLGADGRPQDPWTLAGKIARSEIDARFRHCNRAESVSPIGAVDAIVRWLGVRIFGRGRWNDHRKERP